MIRTLRRTAVAFSIACTCSFASTLQAQNTFTVTVQNKTADHPWVNEGWPEGFVIDGDEGAVLTLVRGETYTFQLSNVASIHPFYISTNQSGGGAGIWSEGVDGNMATGDETVTFTVPETAPDLLYYQCAFHARMGGVINVVSGGTAAEREDLPDGIRLDQNYPNPFNPTTEITFALESSNEVTITVFDALGREVRVLLNTTLPAGDHTARWDGTTSEGQDAPSGTYLYRLETSSASETRSMTLIR